MQTPTQAKAGSIGVSSLMRQAAVPDGLQMSSDGASVHQENMLCWPPHAVDAGTGERTWHVHTCMRSSVCQQVGVLCWAPARFQMWQGGIAPSQQIVPQAAAGLLR